MKSMMHTIPYHFISSLLNANSDFDVSVANDVSIDVTKCALPGNLAQECTLYPMQIGGT